MSEIESFMKSVIIDVMEASLSCGKEAGVVIKYAKEKWGIELFSCRWDDEKRRFRMCYVYEDLIDLFHKNKNSSN